MPEMKIVSLTEGGTPPPTLMDVALTRTFVRVTVNVPPGNGTSVNVTVEPETVPRVAVAPTIAVASVFPVPASRILLVTGNDGDRNN